MGEASRGHLIQLGLYFRHHHKHARAWHSSGWQIVRKKERIPWVNNPGFSGQPHLWPSGCCSRASVHCSAFLGSLLSRARIYTRLQIACWLMFLRLTHITWLFNHYLVCSICALLTGSFLIHVWPGMELRRQSFPMAILLPCLGSSFSRLSQHSSAQSPSRKTLGLVCLQGYTLGFLSVAQSSTHDFLRPFPEEDWGLFLSCFCLFGVEAGTLVHC